MRSAFLVFALCLAWGAAKAQCPAGVGTTACEPFSAFTNSVPLATNPSSTDRTPYVQGSATHYVPPTAIDFRLYGAAPNSATDSSAAIQAAFTANPGGTFTCAGNYYTVANTVSVTTKVHLTDCGYPSSFGGGNDSPVGFYAGTSNLTMFDIHSLGNHFENTYINMMFNNVVNTSGTAIIQEGQGAGNGNGYGTFDHLQIDYACNVISINGIVNTASDINAEQQGGGAQCFGVEVGNLTTAGHTNEPVLHNIFVQTNSSNLPACNFAFFDSSGLIADKLSGLGGSEGGTCIIPGANQNSSNGKLSNSNTGDALGTGPSLLIDPQSNTAKGVIGWVFDSDWASSSQSSCGVVIENPNGSVVDTLTFTALRAYNNHPCGVAIMGVATGTPPTNINITGGSQLCGNGATTGYGLYVNDAAAVPPANVSFTDSTSSAQCAGEQAASQEWGVFVETGAANYLTIKNNNLTNNFGLPFKASNLITGQALISENQGITGNVPTLTISGGAVTNFTPYDEIAIDGSGTLTTLDAGWAWRKLIIFDGGTWTINTGGNFCAAFSPTQGVAYTFQWVSTCWARLD